MTRSICYKLSLLLIGISLAACSGQTGNAVAAPATLPAATPAAVDATVREPAAVPVPAVICYACGVVSSISAVKQEGTGTGMGAVIGGIVGGLAGNQVGGGDGKKIATVAGVIGGAVVGNKIEGNRNDAAYYVITVDMDAGGQRTATVANAAALGIGIGSPVTVVGDTISLR